MANAKAEAKARKQRRKKILVNKNGFRSNAEKIIRKMFEMNNQRKDEATPLVNEILHCIFFLGRIHEPPFSPEKIVDDIELLGALRHCYPRSFEHYSSQLPRRSPFSCLLDMIVFLEGQENEDEIRKRLQEIISTLSQKHLVPYAICVSQNKNNQNSACRYYGVSMSKMLPEVRRIMISASCLGKYWHSYVAGAVMTYHPEDTKHPGFDGTITLPEHVRCETFKLFTVEKVYMPPCKSCQNLFGLKEENNKAAPFPYGNCAEVESVSNLFKNDSEVREKARPNPEKVTDENRKMAAERVRTYLMECLPEGFTQDIQFYDPQL